MHRLSSGTLIGVSREADLFCGCLFFFFFFKSVTDRQWGWDPLPCILKGRFIICGNCYKSKVHIIFITNLPSFFPSSFLSPFLPPSLSPSTKFLSTLARLYLKLVKSHLEEVQIISSAIFLYDYALTEFVVSSICVEEYFKTTQPFCEDLFM